MIPQGFWARLLGLDRGRIPWMLTTIKGDDMLKFHERDVTVTLTGAEWFALLARIDGRTMSAEGAKAYHRATTKMQEQLVADSKTDRRANPPFTAAELATLPEGVTVIGLDDPAVLHQTIKDAVGE